MRIERTSSTANIAQNGDNEGGRPSIAKGAGLYSQATTLRLNNVTLADNMALGGGNQEGSSSGAEAQGEGLFSARGEVFLSQVRVIDNQAVGRVGNGQNGSGVGGGLYLMGVAGIDNVILGGNLVADGGSVLEPNDCHQENSINTLGFNLAREPGNCLFDAPTDRVGLDPDLGSPSNQNFVLSTPNGRAVRLPPNPGSPVVDQGRCSVAGQYFDIWGLVRPSDIGSATNDDDGCDIGVAEARSASEIFSDGFESGNFAAWGS